MTTWHRPTLPTLPSAPCLPISEDPPTLIQAGSNEILLDDSARLAARAASDDVAVILDVTPGVPHLFQSFAAMVEEGDQALDRVTAFLSTHLGATLPA